MAKYFNPAMTRIIIQNEKRAYLTVEPLVNQNKIKDPKAIFVVEGDFYEKYVKAKMLARLVETEPVKPAGRPAEDPKPPPESARVPAPAAPEKEPLMEEPEAPSVEPETEKTEIPAEESKPKAKKKKKRSRRADRSD